jgi:hypothetical protein
MRRLSRPTVIAYAAALLLGALLALWLFPGGFLVPAAGAPWRPVGDAAQHMVAQRYLIADAWRWPPTLAANLNTQEGGLNTAFADSIPALALALKALRGLLPEGFHGVGLFYGLAWLLQPVAAVWALRGAGGAAAAAGARRRAGRGLDAGLDRAVRPCGAVRAFPAAGRDRLLPAAGAGGGPAGSGPARRCCRCWGCWYTPTSPP